MGLQIETRKLSDLIPYDKNPRKNDRAVDAVAASIRQFGFKVPIVVTGENVIVAGHTRFLAAKKLELTEVPCIVARDLTPQQARAFRLADNKVAEIATWDAELLAMELSALTTDNFDISQLGWEPAALEAILSSQTVAGEDVPEELPVDEYRQVAKFVLKIDLERKPEFKEALNEFLADWPDAKLIES